MQRNVEVFPADWVLLPISNSALQVNQSLEIEDWIQVGPIARFDDDTITWRTVALG